MQCRRRWCRNILRSTKNCFHSALHYANKYLFAAFWKNAKHFLELNYISTRLTHWVSYMDPRNISASNKKNVTLDKWRSRARHLWNMLLKKCPNVIQPNLAIPISDFQWWTKKVQHPAQEPQLPTQAVSAITTIQVLTTGPESQWIYTANNRSSSGWSFHKKRNDSQLTRCHHHLGPHYRPNWQDLIKLNNLYAEHISYPLSRPS